MRFDCKTVSMLRFGSIVCELFLFNGLDPIIRDEIARIVASKIDDVNSIAVDMKQQ
jgi:hypothetical protein